MTRNVCVDLVRVSDDVERRRGETDLKTSDIWMQYSNTGGGFIDNFTES